MAHHATSSTASNSNATGPMRVTVQAEGMAIALAALWIYGHSGAGWTLFAVLILAPDLAILGYLAGTRIGALCYNIAHSYLTPLALAVIGVSLSLGWAMPMALIWIVHIGVDRAVGYGLKYGHDFKATHLQNI